MIELNMIRKDFLLVTLIISGFIFSCPEAAVIQVSPMAKSDWVYRFIRCDSWHGPFDSEYAATVQGMNTYYGCGPYIANPGAWGTLTNPQPGPCGSSNYHPSSVFDFVGGIEIYNTRNILVGYGLSCYGTNSQDGLTISRERSAGCPDGYSLVGNICQLIKADPYKDPGPPCPNNGTNPINGGTGNKFQKESDYSQISNGHPLEFVRYYNSRIALDGIAMPAALGNRWGHSYSRSALIFGNSSIQTVAIRSPDGKVYFFNKSGSAWLPTADITASLGQRTDASNNQIGWLYTTEAGDEEIYDMEGRLLSITSERGIIQTLKYSDAETPPAIANIPGLLIQVTDSFGNSLQFTYDSMHRIATMKDPSGGTYSYGYDSSNNLATVTYPDAKIRIYVYGELSNTSNISRPYALTGIVDEANVRYATYQYDTQGMAISSQHAGGVENYQLAYNAAGPGNTVITTPSGNSITYTFTNILGSVKSTGQSQPAGSGCSASASNLTYDPNGNIASKTDFNGNVSCFGYDLSRNLETARVEGLVPGSTCPADPAAYTPAANTVERKITTAWHPDWRLEVRRAEPNKLTTWVYHGQPDPTNNNAVASCAPANALLPNGKLIAVLCKKVAQATTDSTGAQGLAATVTGAPRDWRYTYNATGQVLTVNGPRVDLSPYLDDVTTYSYYADTTTDHWTGDLASVTDALGHVTNYTRYDAHGHPLTLVDPNGLTTTLEYTPRGWLKTKTVGGEVTRYDYDGVGQVTSITQPDGSSLGFVYDDAHRLTEIHDTLGGKIVYTLDALGNRKREDVYDPTGTLQRTHQRVFDALSRLWKDIGGADPAHQITEYAYDANGNRTGVTDPLGQLTSTAYDPLNRLIQVLQPSPSAGQPRPETRYGYDGLDRLVQVTDPRSLVTAYTVDGLGNRTQLASPDSGSSSNTYDEAGNLKTHTDAKNQATKYYYDSLNRLASIRFHDRSAHYYTYDQGLNGIGRLTSISEYARSGRLTNQIDYGYDHQGRVTTETRSIGAITATTQYHYDAGGRLDRITYPSGRIVEYGFDLMGRIQRIDTTASGQTTAQNVVANIHYQPFGGVASFSYGNGQSFQRQYDLDGRLQDYSLGSNSVSVGYDAANQLKTLTDSLSGQVNQYDYDPLGRLIGAVTATSGHGYDYDAVGNRIAQTGDNLLSYGYPADSNRLDSINGLPQNFDANGSLSASPTLQQFTHDVRGRLVQANAAGVTTTYQVDALGRRIRKTHPNGDVLFHYDLGGRLIAETDPLGTVLKEYLYLNDLPVAVVAQ